MRYHTNDNYVMLKDKFDCVPAITVLTPPSRSAFDLGEYERGLCCYSDLMPRIGTHAVREFIQWMIKCQQ